MYFAKGWTLQRGGPCKGGWTLQRGGPYKGMYFAKGWTLQRGGTCKGVCVYTFSPERGIHTLYGYHRGSILAKGLRYYMMRVSVYFNRCHLCHLRGVYLHWSSPATFFLQRCEASWWCVCYQQGLPCLVFL